MRFKDLEIKSIPISKALENSLDLFFFQYNIENIQEILIHKDKFSNIRNVGKIRIKEFEEFILQINKQVAKSHQINDVQPKEYGRNFTLEETQFILNHVQKKYSKRLHNILNQLFRVGKIKNIYEFNKIRDNFKKIRNAGNKTIKEIQSLHIENILSEFEVNNLEKDFSLNANKYRLILETYGNKRIKNRINEIYLKFIVSDSYNYIENLQQIEGIGEGAIREIVNLISEEKNEGIINNTENEKNYNHTTLKHYFPKLLNYFHEEKEENEIVKYILSTIKTNQKKWNFKETKIVAIALFNHFKFNDHLTHENLVSNIFYIKIFCLFWTIQSQIYYYFYVILFNDPYISISRERKRQILSKRINENVHDIYILNFEDNETNTQIYQGNLINNHSFTISKYSNTVFLINKKLYNQINKFLHRKNINNLNISQFRTNETTLQSYLNTVSNTELNYKDHVITKAEANKKSVEKEKICKRIENFVEINQHIGVSSSMIADELKLYGVSVNKIQIPNWIRKNKLNIIQKLDWNWVIFNGKYHKDIPFKTFTDYFKTTIRELKNLFEIIEYLRIYYINYRIHSFYALMRIDQESYSFFKNNYILGLSLSNGNTREKIIIVDKALRSPCQKNLHIIQNNPIHSTLENWFSQFTLFELNSKKYYLSHIHNEHDYIDQADFFKNNYRQENIIFLFNNKYLNFHGKNILINNEH